MAVHEDRLGALCARLSFFYFKEIKETKDATEGKGI